MPVMTLGCAHGQHAECTSKHCDCDCHKDTLTLRQERNLARAAARELAHQAVKDFDRSPDLITTQTAILALTQYEQILKDDRHGR